jgi:hypothetical protein
MDTQGTAQVYSQEKLMEAWQMWCTSPDRFPFVIFICTAPHEPPLLELNFTEIRLRDLLLIRDLRWQPPTRESFHYGDLGELARICGITKQKLEQGYIRSLDLPSAWEEIYPLTAGYAWLEGEQPDTPPPLELWKIHYEFFIRLDLHRWFSHHAIF